MSIDKSYIKQKVQAQGILNSLDIIAVKSDSWLGKVIKSVTEGCYSHIAIVTHVQPIDGNKIITWLVESESAGFIPGTLKELWATDTPQDFDVFRFPGLLPENVHLGLDWIEENLYTPYDYKDLLSFPLRRWVPFIGNWLADKVSSRTRMICSEAGADCGKAALALPADWKSESTSPVSLCKVLVKKTVEI